MIFVGLESEEGFQDVFGMEWIDTQTLGNNTNNMLNFLLKWGSWNNLSGEQSILTMVIQSVHENDNFEG